MSGRTITWCVSIFRYVTIVYRHVGLGLERWRENVRLLAPSLFNLYPLLTYLGSSKGIIVSNNNDLANKQYNHIQNYKMM